jgi:hypothetical protein
MSHGICLCVVCVSIYVFVRMYVYMYVFTYICMLLDVLFACFRVLALQLFAIHPCYFDLVRV